jgi:hypothetical protein
MMHFQDSLNQWEIIFKFVQNNGCPMYKNFILVPVLAYRTKVEAPKTISVP